MTGSKKLSRSKIVEQLTYHTMLFPATIIVILFCYLPMVGILIAFQNFNPVKGFFGSQFIGLDNFKYVLMLPDALQVIKNTLYITLYKLIAIIVFSLFFSLLLNEVRNRWLKKVSQTIVFFPYFISWVILSGIIVDILSPGSGIVNLPIKALGYEPIFFMAKNAWFTIILVVSYIWKDFGYASVICLGAIAAIEPELYEAAWADGAGRFRQIFHITLPGIMPTLLILVIICLSTILSGQFEQIYNLYNPIVYKSGDIIDTFVYRVGIQELQFGVAATLGLMKSLVQTAFVVVLYKIAYKFANYRMF